MSRIEKNGWIPGWADNPSKYGERWEMREGRWENRERGR